MAPERTDPEGGEVETAQVDTSTVSVDSAISDTDHDPYFEPVVSLPVVQIKTNEEDEEELLKLRCKLFRYYVGDDEPAIWKERGTGDVKILKRCEKKMIGFHHSMFAGYDEEDNDEDKPERDGEYYNLPVEEIKVRLLMRQDKTLKIRANHYITPFMDLKPNCGSDRAWVWSAPIDFADEEPKKELFAVKFANAEHARLFKEKFDEGKGLVTNSQVKAKEVSETVSKTETPKKEESKPKTEEETNQPKTEEKTTVEATKEVIKELETLSVKENEKE